jgi:4-alpha-glucanotransferase
LPIIAEDLGIVTAEVSGFMQRNNFPGMKVLLFAFGEGIANNPYAPHNHVENCLVYTGTHDNDTVRGWFKKEGDKATRERLQAYLGLEITEHNIAGQFIRLAMMSVAKTAIMPVQDLLNLDATARMNTPGTASSNWAWRLAPGLLDSSIARNLASVTEMFGRA